jgi:hypothetical protein
VCRSCVAYLRDLVLENKDPLHKRYIHPEILEMGDPNFPSCTADLVARATWFLLQRQDDDCTTILEFLRHLSDRMKVVKRETVFPGDRVDVVEWVFKQATPMV